MLRVAVQSVLWREHGLQTLPCLTSIPCAPEINTIPMNYSGHVYLLATYLVLNKQRWREQIILLMLQLRGSQKDKVALALVQIHTK